MRSEGPAITGTVPAALERDLVSLHDLLAQGNFAATIASCEALRESWPAEPALLRLQGKAAEGIGDLGGALALAREAVALRPRNVRARLRLVRCLWRMGEPGEALAGAEAITRTAGNRPGALLRVAEFYEAVGRHEAAYRCRRRVLELVPDDPLVIGATADSAAALGCGSEAAQLYDRALYADPAQALLLERRSRLPGRAVSERHAAQLGYSLDALPPDDPRRAPVCYALARELEGLGHYAPAFGIWSEGARCRALALAEDADIETVALGRIESTFDGRWLRDTPAREPGDAAITFLVGLPECGLERLAALLGHETGGCVFAETGLIADATIRLAGVAEGWAARLEAAVTVDPAALASAYGHAAGQLSQPGLPIIDASCAHLWHLGLLARAFPGARIVHLRRDPLDHCLALYTTLFGKGHGWSYDLDSLARHYAAYHRLIGHWRRHLPGRIIDLDYEQLVLEPRVILDQLGVRPGYVATPNLRRDEAESGVPARHPEPGACTGKTACEAGIGRAAHYARELAPLARRLREDGVPVG